MSALPFKPLALPAGATRRRLEVFSPKVLRRLSLSSYQAWRCWLAIEANPAINTFCERPARLDGAGSAILDFWVELRDKPGGEFWLLVEDVADKGDLEPTASALPSRVQGRPLRQVTRAMLESVTIALANWAQIVPYLVSFRVHRQPVLEQSIVVELARWTCLGEVIERFAEYDGSAVEASVFWLVASGRIESPDLATAPLTRSTRFRRL